MTAVTPAVREIVLTRAGWHCEHCYAALDGPWGYSVQHRDARGMGGSRQAWLGEPPNLLALCGSGTTECHGRVEHHPAWAYQRGLALRTGDDPERTPFMDANGAWWLLIADTKHPITIPFTYQLEGATH
ncbi:MAG: HNH endonuclease [Actinomycetota bacterium]|nr:HNH endonuclease [Actinomycetota bacterium]